MKRKMELRHVLAVAGLFFLAYSLMVVNGVTELDADILNLQPSVKSLSVSPKAILPSGSPVAVNIEAVLSDLNGIDDITWRRCLAVHESDLNESFEATAWTKNASLSLFNQTNEIEGRYSCSFNLNPSDKTGGWAVYVFVKDMNGLTAGWFSIISFASVEGNIWVLDSDSDGYHEANTFRLAESKPSGAYIRLLDSKGVDCYDKNAKAYPSQILFFASHRGDGSYDYNCDGVQEKKEEDVVKSCLDTASPAWCATIKSVPPCGSAGLLTSGTANGVSCVCVPSMQACR